MPWGIGRHWTGGVQDSQCQKLNWPLSALGCIGVLVYWLTVMLIVLQVPTPAPSNSTVTAATTAQVMDAVSRAKPGAVITIVPVTKGQAIKVTATITVKTPNIILQGTEDGSAPGLQLACSTSNDSAPVFDIRCGYVAAVGLCMWLSRTAA